MSVEAAFSQWYQQLSPSDQQTLYQFIKKSWSGEQPSGKPKQPSFTGHQVPYVRQGKEMVKCPNPNCGMEFEIKR